MKKVKVRGKYVFLSLVFLVLGFMLSYSYQFAKVENEQRLKEQQWTREYQYKQMLIDQEQANIKLQKELATKQANVRKVEEKLAKQEQVLFNLVEDVEKLRMYTGKIKVKGKGIEVTLSDSSYIPTEENVNNYIVHENHVFNVVNELLIAGASAVSINGQRLTKESYVACNGPVITIDGNQFPAPFVISAIGDPDVLYPALNIAGGVKDQLVEDHVVVKISKQDAIEMSPVIGSEAR
ncbi:DUF881 domain-containing protein [Metabacillus iocasae]|uniref:Uncharacterized protein YlxW (UPF0749 family) n=1 Tax=Priestia iocasae TaxID=2291674 RepID=A0ABS2QSN8_9BACI|nr:DUF881 domain-containing protein [Metabacillus iocasae]MBM7701776.1 uncharacterized protein YlxW (UPF0749 family) [Metabacillus iocasae]